jgi:hypothetical protein
MSVVVPSFAINSSLGIKSLCFRSGVEDFYHSLLVVDRYHRRRATGAGKGCLPPWLGFVNIAGLD